MRSITSLVAVALVALGQGGLSAAEPVNLDALIHKDKIKPRGQFYQATVPDTLDLAERARLSLNCLIGNLEPATFYGVYQGFQFNVDPPKPHALTWNITAKNGRTLPLLRTITGRDFGADVEAGMMRALVGHIHKDGLMYYPFDGAGPPKGTSYPQINALVMFAILNWYERDGNPAWLELHDLLAGGLRHVAIRVEDRAFYPVQSGIKPDGSWHYMLGAEPLAVPYVPPNEPQTDQEGHEGAAKSDQLRPIGALAQHFRRTGDRRSLDLAKKLARFCLKRAMWVDTPEMPPGNEQGQWGGHFHNNTLTMMALLELAQAGHDPQLMQFVRQAYDHARRSGVLRLGWFPAWSTPLRYQRPAILGEITEPCALADLCCLAVKLSDAGLGDYWDDADAIIRNHLIAQQISDLDRLRHVSGGKPENDGLRRRFLGGFASGDASAIQQCDMAGCCSANGAQGICYVWNGITRFKDGVATVNLFLNRAAPWMDVDSYLPYEGKVVLHNKQAHTAVIRIPGWVDIDRVQSFVNDQASHSVQVGHSLLFQKMAPKDQIRLEFPIEERTDRHIIYGKVITVTYRASTVIGIAPQDPDPKKYRLYDRETLRGHKAPMKQVTRFVADKLIPLGPF
jgi:hypothetical protein